MFVPDLKAMGGGSFTSPRLTQFGLFVLAFFILPSIATAQGTAIDATSQALALTRPAVTMTLNSDAEWRAPKQVEFDRQGAYSSFTATTRRLRATEIGTY